MEERTCSIEGCERGGKITRGWCGTHYQRWRKNGDPLVASTRQRTCSIADCDRPIVARKLCKPHYRRLQEYGDPLGGGPIKRAPNGVLEFLKEAARSTSQECIDLRGYKRRPRAHFNGQVTLASRIVWMIARGNPGRTSVLHTCHRGEQGCVNINHLYLGDQQRNMRDMAESGRASLVRLQGESNPNAKLSSEQVEEIRARYIAGGVTTASLAREYGVSDTTVWRCVTKRSYRYGCAS